MAWTYNPQDGLNCWPKGEYPAALASCEETVSKKDGTPMLKIGLTCWRGREEMTLTDYIVNKPGALWKLKQMAKALGRGDEYEAGTFYPGDYTGANLVVELDVEESDKYGDRNKVTKYRASESARPATAAPSAPPRRPAAVEPLEDEDIPFDCARHCRAA